MNPIHRQPRIGRLLTPATIAALGLFAGLPAPAHATVPDACGLITQHDLAAAFGLTHAIKHTSAITEPGNTSGVLHQVCRSFAWRGPKPTNATRKKTALLAGRMAQINIHTWVPDEGPNAHLWRMRFDSAVKKQRGAASALFLKRLHGTRLAPPRFGADYSIAFHASVGMFGKAQGLWWNRADRTLISMNILEARDEPVIGSLKKVAASIVPGFKP